MTETDFVYSLNEDAEGTRLTGGIIIRNGGYESKI